MKKVVDSGKRFCGNCRYHNTYDYPDKVFCFVRFQKLSKPVVSIFDYCDQWEYKPQKCFCLEGTLKKKKT